MHWFADLDATAETVPDRQEIVRAVQRPCGGVAAITPLSYPVILATYKTASGLLAGNTIVVKPSPYTLLSTLRMGQLLRGALRPGVLNIVSGGDQLGACMTAQPVPANLGFTCWVATGKRAAAAAAAAPVDLKWVNLELGGNDPAIVLDAADPAAIADRLFWEAFTNTGQVCAAVKRLYVPDGLFSAVVEALAERARSVKAGNGADESTELGPLNNRPQQERERNLVDDTVDAGAQVVTGRISIDRPSYSFEPTILTGITEGVQLVDEEQFGPALPALPHSCRSRRAIERKPLRRRARRCGAMTTNAPPTSIAARWVNAHHASGAHLGFSGMKASGPGVENGLGYHDFTQLQVIHNPSQPSISVPFVTSNWTRAQLSGSA